ncbi:MAG: hypothetical protein M1829_006133 [Trizodia sp. TS-e1964]|nr:MAG: hypothetical protein M1829_006133 [Trizodia sp. TS-e1964]
MFFSTTSVLVALAGLPLYANAHMVMKTPVPYGNPDNSPLLPDGSNFPCKHAPGLPYEAGTTANIYPQGSSQTLSFTGSAVHGGGSCQISVTKDLAPNKNSDFRVIHSIEGGCPSDAAGNLTPDANGNGASKFAFTIPKELEAGKYTIAWTWFNNIGNREMYMNCGPLEVTASKAKRAEPIQKRDFFSSLPKMFVAHISNGCSMPIDGNIRFPNPGASLDANPKFTLKNPVADPAGSCGETGSMGPSPASSGAGSSSVKPVSSTSSAAGQKASGGVFAAGAASGTLSGSSMTMSVSTMMTMTLTSTVAAGPITTSYSMPSSMAMSSIPMPSSSAPPMPMPSGNSTPPTSSSATTCSAANAGKSMCSSDGKQIGMCDSTGKVVFVNVSQGTVCKDGYQVALKARGLRFFHSHARRGHSLF